MHHPISSLNVEIEPPTGSPNNTRLRSEGFFWPPLVFYPLFPGPLPKAGRPKLSPNPLYSYLPPAHYLNKSPPLVTKHQPRQEAGCLHSPFIQWIRFFPSPQHRLSMLFPPTSSCSAGIIFPIVEGRTSGHEIPSTYLAPRRMEDEYIAPCQSPPLPPAWEKALCEPLFTTAGS